MTTNELLALICKNNADEQDALRGYFMMKAQVNAWGEERTERYKGIVNDITEKVNEIISEEMKHSKILEYITEQLSYIKPEE